MFQRLQKNSPYSASRTLEVNIDKKTTSHIKKLKKTNKKLIRKIPFHKKKNLQKRTFWKRFAKEKEKRVKIEEFHQNTLTTGSTALRPIFGLSWRWRDSDMNTLLQQPISTKHSAEAMLIIGPNPQALRFEALEALDPQTASLLIL